MISNYLESNYPKENLKYRDKVIFILIEELSKSAIEEKFYANLIKNFLKKNFLIYEGSAALSPKEKGKSRLKQQINYDDFLKYLKELNLIFTLNNENNFMTDFIIYLVRILFDGDSYSNNNANYPLNLELKNAHSNTSANCSSLNSHSTNNMSNKINKNNFRIKPLLKFSFFLKIIKFPITHTM